MREIKFQYLFKFEDGKIHPLTVTLEELEQYDYVRHNLQRGNELIAKREYTGLKDKNGKEIYEGDIVKRLDNAVIWLVVWHKAGFYFAWKEDEVSTGMVQAELYEVIGNIYENPELLEK